MLIRHTESTVLGITVCDLVQWLVEFFFPPVLPCPVPYDNEIESQIAPPADAQGLAEACREKFGVRELALAFIPRRSPGPRSNIFQPHTPHHPPLNANSPLPYQSLIASDNPTRIVTLPVLRSEGSDQREAKDLPFRSRSLKPSSPRFLIANLELEHLASRTKRSLLRFSNRKKIAVFHPRPSPPIGELTTLSSPLACQYDRFRCQRTIHPHISNRNIRFTEFRSTYCKHMPYQISNRNKNAHFAFSDPTSASHKSHAAIREPRTTTRAAFRSTIPARPHADR
jgi:hypothetical protein